MKSYLVNVVDFELTTQLPFSIVEIGLTVVDTRTLCVVKTISIPINIDGEVDWFCSKLTGWTKRKLTKQGVTLSKACSILMKYGSRGRLTVVDTDSELDQLRIECEAQNIPFPFGPSVLNISTLYNLIFGDLESKGVKRMLNEQGLDFIGKPHRADCDSMNIGRLLVELLGTMRGNLLHTSFGGL
jgi:inhibitor of KinA sporulation pathway (predicted exonuclease)